MMKNHINFAHPNEWLDSLTSPVESSSHRYFGCDKLYLQKYNKTQIQA